ncbi:MAG: PqqD family protein [bacterium]|nr:PqqD family protein [bacterium]
MVAFGHELGASRDMAISVNLRLVLRKRSDLTERHVDDEAVVLDTGSGRVHQLNPTAWFIWDRCDGLSSVEEIILAIAKAYGMEVSEVESDVIAALDHFREEGLLEP